MQEILINNAVHETRVAVLEDGVLQELRIERNADVSLIGNIYLGVVGKVLPGMQSAFVEIGLREPRFCMSVICAKPTRKTAERFRSSGFFTTAKWFSSRSPKIRSVQKALDSPPKSV